MAKDGTVFGRKKRENEVHENVNKNKIKNPTNNKGYKCRDVLMN
jgi:hypothetical protein